MVEVRVPPGRPVCPTTPGQAPFDPEHEHVLALIPQAHAGNPVWVSDATEWGQCESVAQEILG